MTVTNGRAAQDDRLGGAFADAEQSAFLLMARARLITVTILIIFMAIQFRNLIGLYWISFLVVGGLAGWVHYRLRLRYRDKEWITIAFLLLDVLVVVSALLIPNPFVPDPWPIQTTLRFHSFPYYFVFLGLIALTYSPRFVAWMGGFVVLAWGIGSGAILLLPNTKTFLDFDGTTTGPTGQDKLAFALDPHFVSIAQPIQDIVLFIIVATILAASVWRSKRLVERQVATARERTNLARYFSPGMIEQLAGSDEPLGAVRSQEVAVLFADIVGFTALSEKEPAEKVIALLRDFHGRMARDVFAHDGTVDKYIGDAIMATFGTPHTGPNDATNALACAHAMLGSVDDLNRGRQAAGEPTIRIGIGLHYGPVVLGDIGDERRLEYAVIGDTVNVAARLEAKTREIGAPMVVSGDTVERVKRENGGASGLANLRRNGNVTVRGRSRKIPLWVLGEVATGSSSGT